MSSPALAFLGTEAYARRRAVEQLTPANLADPTVVYALRRVLASDRDVAVRALAAGALGCVHVDPHPVDTHPVDPRPVDPRPVDPRPVDPHPVDPRPVDPRPVDPRPVDTRSTCATVPDVVPWLIDALGDMSPVVRDAAIRALARHAAIAAYAPLCALARTDTTWWVRRAAIYALGVIGARGAVPDPNGDEIRTALGVDPIAPARAALTDPFWRVRHAAIQVLTVYGNRSPERRPEILASLPSGSGGTAEYLSALWGPTLVGDASRERTPSRLPAELLDRDPAVVTARLAEMESPPSSIVELLCDPHVPLRTLAAARLIEANDAGAFADALNWLDEPRIPHVANTVTTMLDSLGDAALALATRVLSAPSRPGASRWAIGWVVATRYMDLAPLAWSRAVELDERASAMAVAPVAALIDALGARSTSSGDDVIAAADELLLRPARVRNEVLAAVEPHASSVVRMRLAAAAEVDQPPHCLRQCCAPDVRRACDAGIERDPSIERHLRAALDDRDPLTRATALARAGSLVSAETRADALGHPDPAIRESVIAHATLDELTALLHIDRDPWVRRGASKAIVRAIRHARQTRAHTDISPDPLASMSVDGDEWVRTIAIPLLDPERPDHLARIVALAADASVMVQSAIIEKLAEISDDRLRAAVPSALSTTTSAPNAAGPDAFAVATAIDAWIAAGDREPSALPYEAGLRDGRANDARANGARASDARASDVRTAEMPELERRGVGSSGVETTPLVISGAFDLQPGSLRVAAERGVTTYFWEPAYAGMTRFLRSKSERARSQVITGTYHADERSIVKDVDRALKRLRRDALDVYLLFWTRSDARVDEAAFEVMSALKRAGKVRAIGFSTHDRDLAMRALDQSPWDVVMTRHSAAHPGIEGAMLAHAKAKGAGVLTFTALCYGRMLAGDGAPSAQDCYRYSLAQHGVTATISAPRRHRELVENLEVLTAGPMTAEEIERVRAHGAGVRVESQKFNALVRQPTRDAAAAAMAMLEGALAPGEGDRDEACVTPEALQRSLSSRGRGRASLPSAMLRRGRL